MSQYSKIKQNSVNRLRNRAKYDFKTIHGIVNETSVLHVSFVPDPTEAFPVVLPMIGQMGSYEQGSCNPEDQLDCYLHGAIATRVMKLADEAISQGETGLPVCIAATKVDGYVLAVTPFHHSYNFRSAVLHGYAEVVRDDAERLFAMELITNSIIPEQWQNTRTPPNHTELISTNILRVRVHAASAKRRNGTPNYDRKDLQSDEIMNRYWAGVLPIYEAIGLPLAGPKNRVAKVPEHIQTFVKETNKERQRFAISMAEDD